MITLQCDIEFPEEDIPLPFVDYNGVPRTATLYSAKEDAVMQRRSRFGKAYTALSVHWILSIGQMDTFKEFYQTALGNGAALFSIDLRYPENNNLKNWIVRFGPGGHEDTYDEGVWTVGATLVLVDESELAESAALLDWTDFYVQSEESSGGDDIPFYTFDDNPFYVRV